jgi:hypothetical protein
MILLCTRDYSKRSAQNDEENMGASRKFRPHFNKSIPGIRLAVMVAKVPAEASPALKRK